MVVTLTDTGYIKSQASIEYRAQKRGGQGKRAAQMKEGDIINSAVCGYNARRAAVLHQQGPPALASTFGMCPRLFLFQGSSDRQYA